MLAIRDRLSNLVRADGQHWSKGTDADIAIDASKTILSFEIENLKPEHPFEKATV